MVDRNVLTQFVDGALGGGTVAIGFRFVENYLIAPRFLESEEARKKLNLYGRPLGLACQELEYRLGKVVAYLATGEQGGPRTSLAVPLAGAQSIDWFLRMAISWPRRPT